MKCVEEEPIPHQVTPDESVGLEDPADAQCGRSRLGELHRHDRADGEVLGGRRVGVDEQLPDRERGRTRLPLCMRRITVEERSLVETAVRFGQRIPDGKGPLIDRGDGR